MSAATKQLRATYRPTPQAAATASTAKVEWLIAERDGRPVGALRYWAEEDGMHLGLGVVPECQRQGIGRAMVEHLAAIARYHGLAKLVLYTIVQTGNVAIFERWGFKVVRIEKPQWTESATGQELTEALMERELRGA